MKKYIMILIALFMISCDNDNGYSENVKAVKKVVSAFELGDVEIWKEAVSEDLVHSPPVYGTAENSGNYDSALAQAEFYINNFENIKFNNPVYLPGVDTVSLKNNGSVRVYGTWTGTSKSTGREFSNRAYHWFEVEDGKITNAGDFFDATGMVAAVGPVQRNVIVVTIDLKKGKYVDLQKLFETDAGLKTTRNYEGCNHVEGFFNEESSKYVVIQHWDSFEQYNAYADWRFNEDPSGLVGKMLPLISGGADGISIYSNNTGYGFY